MVSDKKRKINTGNKFCFGREEEKVEEEHTAVGAKSTGA